MQLHLDEVQIGFEEVLSCLLKILLRLDETDRDKYIHGFLMEIWMTIFSC